MSKKRFLLIGFLAIQAIHSLGVLNVSANPLVHETLHKNENVSQPTYVKQYINQRLLLDNLRLQLHQDGQKIAPENLPTVFNKIERHWDTYRNSLIQEIKSQIQEIKSKKVTGEHDETLCTLINKLTRLTVADEFWKPNTDTQYKLQPWDQRKEIKSALQLVIEDYNKENKKEKIEISYSNICDEAIGRVLLSPTIMALVLTSLTTPDLVSTATSKILQLGFSFPLSLGQTIANFWKHSSWYSLYDNFFSFYFFGTNLKNLVGNIKSNYNHLSSLASDDIEDLGESLSLGDNKEPTTAEKAKDKKPSLSNLGVTLYVDNKEVDEEKLLSSFCKYINSNQESNIVHIYKILTNKDFAKHPHNLELLKFYTKNFKNMKDTKNWLYGMDTVNSKQEAIQWLKFLLILFQKQYYPDKKMEIRYAHPFGTDALKTMGHIAFSGLYTFYLATRAASTVTSALSTFGWGSIITAQLLKDLFVHPSGLSLLTLLQYYDITPFLSKYSDMAKSTFDLVKNFSISAFCSGLSILQFWYMPKMSATAAIHALKGFGQDLRNLVKYPIVS